MRKIHIFCLVALFFIVWLISCSSKGNLQSKNGNNTESSDYQVSNKTESANNTESKLISSTTPTPTLPKYESNVELERYAKKINNQLNKFSKSIKLNDLSKENFQAQDIEIRIWQYGFFPLRGFVATYKQGKWDAFEIKTTDKWNNPTKRQIAEPKSGWNNWEKFLNDQEFLFNPKSPSFDPDAPIIVIQVKRNQKLVSNIFTTSDEHIYDLFKKIEMEFNVIFFDGSDLTN